MFCNFCICRMTDMCEQFMGLVGEQEVYNVFRKNIKNVEKFKEFLCYGEGIRGDCKKVKSEGQKNEL